jgi:cytochrome c556
MPKAAFAACIAAAALLAGCKGADKPDLTLQQFMAQKVDPTSKVYFNAVQYISDEKGNHDIVPQTDADWEKVRQAAADLQAQGKLLQSDAYTEGRRDDWKKMSADFVTVSQRAEEAAKSKDPDKVFAAAGDVYTVCSGCHTAYPAETKKPAGSAS